MRLRDKLAVVALVLACFAIAFFRIHRLRSLEVPMMPERHYELILNMGLFGHGEDARVVTRLPMTTDRQRVRDELVSSGDFRFHMEQGESHRAGVWEKAAARGPHSLVYSCTVRTEAREYELAEWIEIPAAYPTDVQLHLLAGERVQSASPEIRELFERLVPPADRGNATAVVRAAFDYAHREIEAEKFKGTTDALTCLRLGEGSCGGKSRLFAAACRAGGVPARLVGGLILKNGSWRSSHVWAEAWLGGHWVPFCPLNGHFASVPASYLTLYRGDLPLFTHTRDVNFEYGFHAKRTLAPPAEWRALAGLPVVGTLNLWAAFEQVRIPVDLLKIILMLPFGALVVVFFRNVVGIETFGTFMPALVAVAFRDTGLGWGVALFCLIILVGSLARFGLGRFQLLHTPRLAVILTVTVIFILGVALFGVATGTILPTRVSLFPLAILTLTVERFALMLEEDGTRRAMAVVAGTLLVVAAAYGVMGWESLQVTVLAFPESLLLAVAAFFVTGRWAGIRLTELVRFRRFLLSERRP